MILTQALISFFVTVASATVGAVFGALLGNRIARRRLTMDFIGDYNNDSRVNESFRVVRDIRDEKKLSPMLSEVSAIATVFCFC